MIDVNFDWFKPVSESVSTMFTWMEDNPVATQAIGGAAAGGLAYYNQQQQQKHDEKMYERRKSDALENSRASTGQSDYGSHANKLVGGTGLLTNGRLAGR